MHGKSVLWLVAALLLFVIFSAARIGTADLLSRYAEKEIASWPPGMERLDSSNQADVARALDVAQWLEPGNPDPYEDKARLALGGGGMPSMNAAEKNAALRQGLVQIRRAIALRPASPYSWAILLRLKNALGEYDAEFHRALERAVILGPWEPGLQAIVADVGLSAWSALPEAERQMVNGNFVRGMKRQADVMLFIAQAHRNKCTEEHGNAGCLR